MLINLMVPIMSFNFLDDWQNNIQWPNGLTSSQSMGFNDVAPWSADFSNPFKVINFKSIILYLFMINRCFYSYRLDQHPR